MHKKFKVLLLEDDYLQRTDIRDALEGRFGAEVVAKSTELEFQNDFEQIAENPPEVAILDVMVRWTNPTRDSQFDPEIATHPEVAGLRCAEMLGTDPRTRQVKIILYSVLGQEERGEFSSTVKAASLVKEMDLENLLQAVREALEPVELAPSAVLPDHVVNHSVNQIKLT